MQHKKEYRPPRGASIKIAKEEKKYVHLDTIDKLLSEEHYGNYLIVKNSEASSMASSRVYLSLTDQQEYYIAKKNRGDLDIGGYPTNETVNTLLTKYPEDEKFIRDVIKVIVPEIITYGVLVGRILPGMGLFLKFLKKKKIKLYASDEIMQEHQVMVMNNISSVAPTQTNRLALRRFFGAVELYNKNITAIEIGKDIINELESMPSPVAYKMYRFAITDIEKKIPAATEYLEWMKEHEVGTLFSLENLAFTYYDGATGAGTRHVLNHISKSLYGMQLNLWKSRWNGSCVYIDNCQKSDHQKMIQLARSGKNIEINSEKMAAYWFKEVVPNYPFSNTMKIEYTDIWKDFNTFSRLMNTRSGLKSLQRLILPNLHDMYLFILVIIIREGLNLETLRSWKIKKDERTKKYILGDVVGSIFIIKGVKNRSNTEVNLYINSDGELKKYIDFYLLWATPIYDRSDSNMFFQYINESKLNIKQLGPRFFTDTQSGPNSFLNRHIVLDMDNSRITHIDHMTIRGYTNFADSMHKKNEYLRQQNKSHQSPETLKKHYEQSNEWNTSKQHKIAVVQELVIDIFRGKITKEDNSKVKVFGVLSDCANPKEPSFPGAKKLKEKEYCSDWFMCLTYCKQSIVIPKIHGPVIYAWKEHMDQQREDFMSYENWEKEYLFKYEATEAVLIRFSKEDLQFASENAGKYKALVNMKFKSIRKVG